jgi:hypothetical protein
MSATFKNAVDPPLQAPKEKSSDGREAWDSLGPPGKRSAPESEKLGTRKTNNASERAGTSMLARVFAPEQLRRQGGLALCSPSLSAS